MGHDSRVQYDNMLLPQNIIIRVCDSIRRAILALSIVWVLGLRFEVSANDCPPQRVVIGEEPPSGNTSGYCSLLFNLEQSW